jgi:hypothetical protein
VKYEFHLTETGMFRAQIMVLGKLTLEEKRQLIEFIQLLPVKEMPDGDGVSASAERLDGSVRG